MELKVHLFTTISIIIDSGKRNWLMLKYNDEITERFTQIQSIALQRYLEITKEQTTESSLETFFLSTNKELISPTAGQKVTWASRHHTMKTQPVTCFSCWKGRVRMNQVARNHQINPGWGYIIGLYTWK